MRPLPAQARRRAVLAALLAAPLASRAQAWPARPVRLVVPYAAGGIADIGGRLLAERLAAAIGQPVVVDNRGGGGGQTGTDLVAKAAPDGHTLLLTTNGSITFAPVTNKALPYNPLRDLAPVAAIGTYGLILVVHPQLPVQSVAELVEYARRNPRKLNYSTPGAGSGTHFAGEMFNILAGVDIVHVPYKGAGPALQDVVAGNVQLTYDGAAKPFIDAGRLRALATTDVRRDPRFPSVPTLDEAGLAGYKVVGWLGLFAPPGTSRDIVQRLNAATNAAMAEPPARSRLAELGLLPLAVTPERLSGLMAEEIEANRRVAAQARLAFD